MDHAAPVDRPNRRGPNTSHPRPTQRVAGFCTTRTRNEMPVAIPPTIAKSGQSTPAAWRFGRAVRDLVAGAQQHRIRMIETWATVKESVAPSE